MADNIVEQNSEQNSQLNDNEVSMPNTDISSDNQIIKPVEVPAENSEPTSGETTSLPPHDDIDAPTQEPEQEPVQESIPISEPTPIPTSIPAPTQTVNPLKNILEKCKQILFQRKQKKLEKLFYFIQTKKKITNADVCKFLRVSQATATRYLDSLEKQNRIKQTGKVGHSVFYELKN